MIWKMCECVILLLLSSLFSSIMLSLASPIFEQAVLLSKRRQPNNIDCNRNEECISDCCIYNSDSKGKCIGRPEIGQVCGLANVPGSRLPDKIRYEGLMNHVNLRPIINPALPQSAPQSTAYENPSLSYLGRLALQSVNAAQMQYLQNILLAQLAHNQGGGMSNQQRQNMDPYANLGYNNGAQLLEQNPQPQMPSRYAFANIFRSGPFNYDYGEKDIQAYLFGNARPSNSYANNRVSGNSYSGYDFGNYIVG